MTVKELKERLEGYPDDMPVVVKNFVIEVKKDKFEDVTDFEILVPSIAPDTPMSKKLFKDYKLTETFLNDDETVNNNPMEHYSYKSFYENSKIRFKHSDDCKVVLEENYCEIILVIGESNIAVDNRETDKLGTHKFFEECLLIN